MAVVPQGSQFQFERRNSRIAELVILRDHLDGPHLLVKRMCQSLHGTRDLWCVPEQGPPHQCHQHPPAPSAQRGWLWREFPDRCGHAARGEGQLGGTAAHMIRIAEARLHPVPDLLQPLVIDQLRCLHCPRIIAKRPFSNPPGFFIMRRFPHSMEKRNLREVVESVRQQVIREERLAHTNGTLGELQHRWAEELGRLRLAYDYLHGLRHTVGSMPPAPDTWRARMGAHLVRIVQRMLFWYTPQVLRFHGGVLEVLERSCTLFEQQLETMERLGTELDHLRAEVRATALDAAAAPHPPSHDGCIDAFRFAWLRRTRPVNHAALDAYLHVLRKRVTPEGAASLLVFGGPAEWLKLLRQQNYRVEAADSSAAAIAWYRQMDIAAAHLDPLEFLGSREAASAAAVTAFGILERFPFDRTIAFVRQAARVLQPGGVLLIETADPARLPSPAHDFWEDPAALRPLPLSLMEFLFDYCGLTIVERFAVDPPQAVKPFPLAGLELVDRLNNHFYGPRIYALAGRR